MNDLKCPYCNGHMNIMKRFKHGKDFYVCECYPKCNTYVAKEKYSDRPLGFPVDETVRKLRHKAHEKMIKYGRLNEMSRRQVYKWLSDKLGISLRDCHIGMFDSEMCEEVIKLCSVAI